MPAGSCHYEERTAVTEDGANHREHIIIKGVMLFTVWLAEMGHPTHAGLLWFGETDSDGWRAVLVDV